MGFLSPLPSHPVGEAYVETAFRTILFTDIVGSTTMTQRLGDAAAMELVRTHDQVVRRSLDVSGGSEVKHTGDGIMASFGSVTKGIECAKTIQRELDAKPRRHSSDRGADRRERGRAGHRERRPLRRRGAARRSCVQPRRSRRDLVSTAVRELCLGKGFVFERAARSSSRASTSRSRCSRSRGSGTTRPADCRSRSKVEVVSESERDPPDVLACLVR